MSLFCFTILVHVIQIKAPSPRLRVSISIRIAYPDKKWNKLNNVGAILVVRIGIRIHFVRKGIRIESPSEPFYPNADDIRTTFSKIRRQKDINFKIFSNITKLCVHLNTVPTKSLETTCQFPMTFLYNTMSYQI